jgi:hypothetical protein
MKILTYFWINIVYEESQHIFNITIGVIVRGIRVIFLGMVSKVTIKYKIFDMPKMCKMKDYNAKMATSVVE